MDFLNFATGGLPSMLSYNGNTPVTSPAVNANQNKGIDNVAKILGLVGSLGNSAANVISAINGNPVNTGNAYGGLATGNMKEGYTINEVEVFPKSSNSLLSASLEHKVDTKPLWLLGGAAAALYFLTRK
ncbi:hypothetical protein [Parapedobacter sp. 2B3]|uniref:hypothetical protein n=1 Tax=Parapedobacter sp. 2B3 TaxID=3342381 RepID=UPI0035B64A75